MNYQSIPFYEELELNEINQNLYSIYYLGINSSLVSKDKLEKIDNKFNIYDSIYIFKIVLFCLEYTFLIIGFILYLCSKYKYECRNELDEVLACLFVTAGILYLLNFIFLIVCLDYQRQYVLDFINKINFDFENNKIDYKWNVAVLIHTLFILIYLILFHCLEDNIEFMDRCYNEVTQRENRHSDIVYIRNNISSTTERNTEEHEKKIKNLNDEIEKLNKKIIDISNEKDDLIKEKNTLQKIISDTIIEKENYKKRYEEIIIYQNEDKYVIKSVLPGEEIMTINFVSMANSDVGHYSLLCKNTDLFIKQEERLYKDVPEFKKYETFFRVDGRSIKRFLTLEENKIKNNAVINIFINENDN